MSVEVVNFGCRVNSAEGQVIAARAQEAGLQNAVIFNSCAVTSEAERQLRQAIRKTRREQPSANIIVTGCAAQIHPHEYSAMPEVNRVLGNVEKLKPQAYALTEAERLQVADIHSASELLAETAHIFTGSMEQKARAFVQVQNGCDHRCTFCIIPFGRGPSRSTPVGAVVEQARHWVEQGYREIVLTGIDITDYGKQLPGAPSLGTMVKRLLKLIPQMERLRISSIDAAEIDDDLLEVMTHEPRLMPHAHLSAQSGDNMILKRMKRRHTRDDLIRLCERLREARPDIVFGADLIAGFPTETEDMFENTVKLVKEAGLTYLHVFPFSARTGTPAARMPQLPKSVRAERAQRLRKAGEASLDSFLNRKINMQGRVLMESATSGHDEQFAAVHFAAPQKVGEIVCARYCSVREKTLLAEPA